MADDDEDPRIGRRRVDVTLCLHLDGDDVSVDTGAIVAGVEEALCAMTIYAGPMRMPFVIDHVDDPLHVHSLELGVKP
jgi:hypothetical protein